MKQWYKVLIVPITIAILSLVTNFQYNQLCQCPSNMTTCTIINSIDVDDQNGTENLHTKANNQVNPRPKFWFHHPNGEKYHLLFETVKKVLTILDLQKIDMNLTQIHDKWDILWSYHFHDLQYLPFNWSSLKYYQKINHIPGNYVISSKSVLGTSTSSKYIPKAFTNVEKLREYAAQHPDKRFVIKLKSNRGVQLKNVSEMNFTENQNLLDYFAQEFIDNPLLFNGHKFDFAIYVAVTSIQPLRVYYYTKNMIFRFCPKTYDLSDPTDTDRYVVSDSKVSVWEFEGTKKYFQHGYNTKDAFEGFLWSIGADVDGIWVKVEECIREILMKNEEALIYWTNIFKTTKHNHFELFRFDMILDANLNLHLIEINQHPNLYPSRHFARNKDLYENLLYNLFNLIGVGTPFKKESLQLPSMDVETMIAHSLNVNPETCISDMCSSNCNGNCVFCEQCLAMNDRYEQLVAYREQMNLGEFKRIFPPEQRYFDKIESDLWHKVSKESRNHAKWFTEMCKKNLNFC